MSKENEKKDNEIIGTIIATLPINSSGLICSDSSSASLIADLPNFMVSEDGIYKREQGRAYSLLMTREAFVEAYKKYIEGED